MKKSFITILTLGAISITSVLGYMHYKNSKTTEIARNITTTKENSKTQLYGVLNVPMEKNNMIWCGTLQLAWNELRDNIIKDDIKLIGEDKLSSELNKKPFDKSCLNEKDYIAMVGYNKDGIVDKINKSLKDKFNEDGNWKVQTTLKYPDDILAYSFLKKNLEFKYAFEDVKEGLEFNGTKVKSFGISEIKDEEIKDKLAQQVKILYYNDDDNFIISLKGNTANDEIILAKISPKDTLNNTLNYVSGKVDNCNEIGFSSRDILKIPMLGFSINKDYKELENKPIANKGFQDYALASVIQRVDFTLTEKGAQLKSKAEIGMVKSARLPEKPKKLIFDKPFLVYMKEKDSKSPYFVMWVDNSDIMMK